MLHYCALTLSGRLSFPKRDRAHVTGRYNGKTVRFFKGVEEGEEIAGWFEVGQDDKIILFYNEKVRGEIKVEAITLTKEQEASIREDGPDFRLP